jgi:hypothetical protein
MRERNRAAHRISFLLGLPTLVDNALWHRALASRPPVLISADALSRWRTDSIGCDNGPASGGRNLHLAQQHPVSLDSAGFVSAKRYNGLPWPLDAYLDLCAAAPWRWFPSAD